VKIQWGVTCAHAQLVIDWDQISVHVLMPMNVQSVIHVEMVDAQIWLARSNVLAMMVFKLAEMERAVQTSMNV